MQPRISYFSINRPYLFQSSHNFLKIPLPAPSRAPMHISLSYVPKILNNAYIPGAKAFWTGSSIIKSGYTASKATYSIINHGTCLDTALPVLAFADDNCRLADCEVLLRHITEGGDVHIVRTRENSCASVAEQDVVSHGGGRNNVSRTFREAIGVVFTNT